MLSTNSDTTYSCAKILCARTNTHQKLLWLHSSLRSPKSHQRRLFGKIVLQTTKLAVHYSLADINRMIKIKSLCLVRTASGGVE
jgi:hypothetical protein